MLFSIIQRLFTKRAFPLSKSRSFYWKGSRMNVFVQKLNVLTGNTEWYIQDEDYDFHQEIARSAFADMLHDTDRNQKYYEALKKVIKEKHDAGEKAHVLDIGTGTGLLSMMAAACGADTIVACECFQPIASIAREVIAANGFDGRIKVVGKRSTELVIGEDMERRANILVTEVFDTELIGEGAVETFNHAHQHLLEVDAKVIPCTGRMYGLVLESSLLADHNRLRDKWDLSDLKKGNASNLPITLPKDIIECKGSPALHDIQVSQLPSGSFRKLTKPVEIFRFNFSKGGLKKNEVSMVETNVLCEGRGDCVVIWWELDMVPEENGELSSIQISCAPTWVSPAPWRDHWMQAVYHLPHPLSLSPSTPVQLISYHDQFSMWFDLYTNKASNFNEKAPVCSCGFHVTNSRTRTAAMNDLSTWKKCVKTIANTIDHNSVVFFCGDTSLLPLATAQLGAMKVYLVEENTVAFGTMKSIIETNHLEDRVILLPKYDKDLISEKVTHIISEPYLRAALFPWEHLRVWYLTREMFCNETGIRHNNGTSTPIIMPCSATIWALPVQFEHLHKIRAPLGTVESFDLSAFDKLIKSSSDISDAMIEVHPLWEYPCIAMATPAKLMTFDLKQAIPDKCIASIGDISFESEGICNGVALWMEWEWTKDCHFGSGIDNKIENPAQPGHKVHWNIFDKQAVYFFYEQNNKIAPGSKISYNVTFEPSDAVCSFYFEFVK